MNAVDAMDAPGTATAVPGAPAPADRGSALRSPVAWLRSWPPLVQDIALTIGIALAQVAGVFANAEEVTGAFGARPTDSLAIGLAVVSALPLMIRRRYPFTALLLCLAGTLAILGFDYGGVAGYSILAAVYSLVVHRDLRVGILGGAISVVAVSSAIVAAGVPTTPAARVLDVVVVGTAVALGDATRNRLAAQRADRELVERLAQEKRLEAEAAVNEERTRIARELHDLVAHSMSVVAVQAGVGHHLIDNDPAKAKEALATIEQTSREALTEMRRMLGILRTRTDSGPDLAPQPGLDRVGDLVERAASSGLEVDLEVRGEPVALDPGGDLTAYRVVQEALTNVVKHAGPARVEVLVEHTPAEVVVSVTDDGRGAAATPPAAGSPGHGMGLVGMRERVAVVGGTLTAGPRMGGGFAVTARIPRASAGATTEPEATPTRERP